MLQSSLVWLEKGYVKFGYEGPVGLKVERLSKDVGINKSSFYHHFAALDVFIEELLVYHLQRVKSMAEKELACKTLDELIAVMVDHKEDLLFNRQLRVHRENLDFEKCFEKTNETTAHSIMGVWAGFLGLEDDNYLAGMVLQLSMENFFLQITDETLNKAWLTNYFLELRRMVDGFKAMKKVKELNGTV